MHKGDFEISLEQKNTNFEVRFYRLVEKVAEKCPQLKIDRLDRGRFSVDTECKIILNET